MPRFRSALLLLLACATGTAPVFGQEDADPPAAEIMPLAAESLLLDLVRMDSGTFVAVGERGHVVTSEDGRNWQQADYVPTRSALTSVTAAGNMLWAAGHDTVILVSDDSGRNWRLQNYDPERLQPIMDIHFRDKQTGWASGAYGLFMATTDGGLSWEEFWVSDDEWHLNGILDLGGDDMLLAGEAGFSFRTGDGGQTWEAIEMPYPGSMFGISRGQDSCILVYGLRGNVQRTCDVGDNWEEIETGTLNTLGGGVSAGGDTVLVGNSGEVLFSSAGGPFESRAHSSGVDFSAVIAVEGQGFMLAGEGGIHRFPEAKDADQPSEEGGAP